MKSDSLEITDTKVKAIKQYHALKDLIFEIADTAGVDISNLNDLHRHFAANILLRNFLGDESYNKYVEYFKIYSNQLN